MYHGIYIKCYGDSVLKKNIVHDQGFWGLRSPGNSAYGYCWAIRPNKLGFSHALPVWLNTQNCAWFGSKISLICCELSEGGGFAPAPPTRGSALDPARGPTCPHLQILATPLSVVTATLCGATICSRENGSALVSQKQVSAVDN